MELVGANASPDVSFRSKSPGPGKYQNLLLHGGVLINTSSPPQQKRRQERHKEVGVPLRSSNAEHRIVSNLRYSLEQFKLSSDKDLYSKLVDCVVVGPATVKHHDLSQVLGINQEFIARSKQNRLNLIQSGAEPSWVERGNNVLRSQSAQSVPKEGRNVPARRDLGPNYHMRSALERLFDDVSRFGGREGRMITLTESDKWMRQGKLLDNWNVTTIDTALAFRKISRGAIWLDYTKWRQFLDELVDKKQLDMNNVIEHLENCGIPGTNTKERIASANPRLFLS